MLEQLHLLTQLQVVDKTLYDLEQEQVGIPERLEQLARREAALTQELEAVSAEVAHSDARRKELEKANDELRTRMRKAENRLMAAKNQREYRAANAELEEGRDTMRGNDDVLLEVMERLETIGAQEKDLGAELKQLSGQAEKERQTLRARLKTIEKQIERLAAKRQRLGKDIEGNLMRQYDFIRQRCQGVALAPVDKGTCLVCHVDIPPQQFNELMRMDKIMTCPSCNRLLYWVGADGFENIFANNG